MEQKEVFDNKVQVVVDIERQYQILLHHMRKTSRLVDHLVDINIGRHEHLLQNEIEKVENKTKKLMVCGKGSSSSQSKLAQRSKSTEYKQSAFTEHDTIMESSGESSQNEIPVDINYPGNPLASNDTTKAKRNQLRWQTCSQTQFNYAPNIVDNQKRRASPRQNHKVGKVIHGNNRLMNLKTDLYSNHKTTEPSANEKLSRPKSQAMFNTAVQKAEEL